MLEIKSLLTYISNAISVILGCFPPLTFLFNIPVRDSVKKFLKINGSCLMWLRIMLSAAYCNQV